MEIPVSSLIFNCSAFSSLSTITYFMIREQLQIRRNKMENKSDEKKWIFDYFYKSTHKNFYLMYAAYQKALKVINSGDVEKEIYLSDDMKEDWHLFSINVDVRDLISSIKSLKARGL